MTFVPHKEKTKTKIEITAREAHLLKYLRSCSFGKIIVHKANGMLVRVESSESILLTDEGGEKVIEELLQS